MSAARLPCPVPGCKVGRSIRHVMCKRHWPKGAKAFRIMLAANAPLAVAIRAAVDAVVAA